VPPYTWSATGLPSGLAINPTTGAISGTPNAAGTFPVTVTVTDGATTSAQRAYTVMVVPPGCPITIVGWRGEYYSNRTLTEPSTLCRDDAAVDFDWRGNAPAPGLPKNGFSIRWTRTQDFAAGSYTFTMGSDAGSRLWVDDVLVIDEWSVHPYPTILPTAAVTLTPGSHTIVMEYFERNGTARATLAWSSTS
jgi:hypothetical protein